MWIEIPNLLNHIIYPVISFKREQPQILTFAKKLPMILFNRIFLMTALSGFHLFLSLSVRASEPDSVRMQWFSENRLGIFIHWGIYSVRGTAESWAFHNRAMPYDEYMEQITGFTAREYTPEQWASLIRKSGAGYAVITSKHHDGVALWDTKANDLSIPARSPARKDVLSPFVEALRKEGLKAGIYFSLLDWSHPDYPGFLKDSARYSVKEDPLRWEKFLEFNNRQLEELQHLVRPDLWWFDGDWEHSAEEWKASSIRKKLLAWNPETLINGRLQGFGDYETPEQNFPVTRPVHPYWELCMTTNDSWGWVPGDTQWKTPYEIISIYADVAGMGGNLLLDIGPREDGSIPEPQVNILTELGTWNHKHREALLGTRAGLPCGHFYGPSTLSKDGQTLYLFLSGNPRGEVVIKGLFNRIQQISVLGENTPVSWKIVGKISWSPVPGLVYISLPDALNDPYMNILKVELDGPLKLYSGKGGLSL